MEREKGNDVQRVGKGLFQAWGVREVVTAVLMNVLTLVLMFAGSSVTMLHPHLAMLASGGAAVFLGAAVFMLMVFRVNRFGVTTLFATMAALMFCTMGNYAIMIPFYIAGGLALDLIFLRSEEQRRSTRWVTAAWSTFSGLYLLSTMIPVISNLDAYIESFTRNFGSDQAFIDAFLRYYTDPLWVCGIAIATVICGFAGCMVARVLMRKHFSKAGAL